MHSPKAMMNSGKTERFILIFPNNRNKIQTVNIFEKIIVPPLTNKQTRIIMSLRLSIFFALDVYKGIQTKKGFLRYETEDREK